MRNRKEQAISSAPIPANEEERIAALRSYAILDTAPDPAYDSFARLAAEICETPLAFVSLVDSSRQWFKAAVGFEAGSETGRDRAFCAHAIASSDDVFEISDASQDPRFAENPSVREGPLLRFYAGAPLVDGAGNALGTICAADRKPHVLSAKQRESLRTVADALGKLIEARKGVEPEHLRQLTLLSAALERAPEPIVIARVRETGSPPEFVYVNRAFADAFKYSLGDVLGRRLSLLEGPSTDRTRIARLVAAVDRGEAGTEIVSLYTSRGKRLIVDIRDRQLNATHRIIGYRDLTHLRLTQAALAESNSRLGSLLRHNKDAVLTLDATGSCLDANASAFSLFDRHFAQLRGWGFAATMGRGIFPQNDPFPETLRAGNAMEYSMSYDRAGRPPLHLECKAVPMIVASETVGAYVIAKDVSEQTRLREMVSRQAERIHALYLISATRAAAEDVQIEAALQLALRSFGMQLAFFAEVVAEQLVVRSAAGELSFPMGQRIALESTYAVEALRARDVFTVDDLTIDPKPGIDTAQWRSYIVAPLPPQAGFAGVVGVAGRAPVGFGDQDREFMRLLVSLLATLIDRQAQKSRLADMAYHDHLTGLPNRAKLMQTLTATLAAARSAGSLVALHGIDLDGFKALNDSAGHHAGDRALEEVALRLSALLGPHDVAARMGGDEFVVLQGSLAHASDATNAGNRIVAALREPFVVEGMTYRLGASVGSAIFPDDASEAPDLLREADRALYRAKEAGKNRAVRA